MHVDYIFIVLLAKGLSPSTQRSSPTQISVGKSGYHGHMEGRDHGHCMVDSEDLPMTQKTSSTQSHEMTPPAVAVIKKRLAFSPALENNNEPKGEGSAAAAASGAAPQPEDALGSAPVTADRPPLLKRRRLNRGGALMKSAVEDPSAK